MTSPETPQDDDREVGPLGSAVSEPARPRPETHSEPAEGGGDGAPSGADGMAGPVYPPEDTEPDAR